MAFPTTSVLDNFNRTNGVWGSAWTNLAGGGLTIATNVVGTSNASNICGGFWNAFPFGPPSNPAGVLIVP